MNIIFFTISLSSLLLIIYKNPSLLLTAFSKSAKNTLNLSYNLLCIYLIWLGFIKLLQDSGLNKKLSKVIKPLLKFLFGELNEKESDAISLSISANLLGLGGVATPSAIEGMKLLDDAKKEKSKTMLFVISATSIQILPLSVMQLLTELGASNPSFIFIPTLLVTFVSTFVGVILAKVF